MVRQERAVRTRQAILVAAASLFDEVGYEAATISAILKRSGVTKGALYFHFASKEELAQAVLASQLDAVPAVPPRDLALQEALDEALLLSHLHSTRDPLVRGSTRLTVEQGSAKDGLDRQVPAKAWLDHTVAVFEKARTRGELLPHVDVVAAATMFVGSFMGVQVLSKIMTDHADMPERVGELYQHLMATIANPGALVGMDFTPGRGARTYEEAMRLTREREAEEDDGPGEDGTAGAARSTAAAGVRR
ncbi:TetR/AcrR family transcriptional regulator [Streptomyces solincola]|uniref:TetR/AcrR family transcriptional regulator n=1 Tax=Streptomyces solincola TaxID=2100817 RepID=A0A2S9PUN3_9ACTN|nr:ScbR family autoregulator-binding transcription factor [Streptomyces solincola]PRH78073.1 TetR/AcrR family transcriptional regulator [Streptomyces solincola]